MKKMTTTVFIYVFAGFLLLFHVVASAELVRQTGRGSRTASAAEEFFLVDNVHVNRLGLAFDFSPINSASLTSGQFPAGAAPRDCYQTFDFDDPFFVNEPCFYRFVQGDVLELFGFTSLYFSDAERVEAKWTISNSSGSWMFASDASLRETTLNAAMPGDLLPGEYSVSLNYTFYSGPNTSFFYNSDNHNDTPNNCGELIIGDANSFTCAYDYEQRDSLSFGFSERLFVVAQVNAPAALSLMLIVGLLFWRRK